MNAAAEGVVDVVVGAGSGMGAAVAAAMGGTRRLVLADRDAAAAEKTAASLERDVQCVPCDITDPDAVRALAAQVPVLGSLVVTAGLSPTMGPGERIFAVNLVGTARLLDALDAAVGAGDAAVCFASIAGHGHTLPDAVTAVLDDPLAPDLGARLRAARVDPDDPGTAYGLSKYGVIRLAARLAAPWARRGARIMSLSPGIIDTPMGRQELAQQPMMQPMIDLVGRMGTAEELASVAAFLVSDGASFMNGCDVLVDGGFTAIAGG